MFKFLRLIASLHKRDAQFHELCKTQILAEKNHAECFYFSLSKAPLLCVHIVPHKYISLVICDLACLLSTQEATLPSHPGPVALTIESLIMFSSMAPPSDQRKLFCYFKTVQACQYLVGISSYPTAVNQINKRLVDSKGPAFIRTPGVAS